MLNNILEENNISNFDLLDIINSYVIRGVDYADLYFQKCITELIIFENNIIKNSFFDFIEGVGFRMISGDRIGFAHSSEITKDSILNLVNKVKFILDDNISVKNRNIVLEKSVIKNNLYDVQFSINSIWFKKKVNFLLYLDNFIRKLDKRINYVSVSLLTEFSTINVVSTDNVYISDIRPLIKLFIKVQVEDNGIRELGFSGGGGRYSYDFLLLEKQCDLSILEYWAKEAVRIAVNNLYANYAPAGNMPVILGSGWPGILLHEAVGHGLEGDFIRKGISVYSNSLGTKIASELCTIIDDGSIVNNRGSLNIDDEGTLSQKNVLVDKGILKSFMLDKFNARLMNLSTTGNARRESYACLPIPRMTNTYLASGKDKLNDIISSVDYGLYIPNLGSGQVDITSGKFVFTILEGYLVKGGKILSPIKGATLIGSGKDTMNKVSMVGDDLKFDSGIGICGKDYQLIPVSVGQPSLKIDSMVVGGLN